MSLPPILVALLLALESLLGQQQGVASWYPARGMIAAAGPGLRHGAWRGSSVVVSYGERSVTVRLADWCACPGRLIDLSDDAFAQLAPLGRGLLEVSVAPAPELPATDRG